MITGTQMGASRRKGDANMRAKMRQLRTERRYTIKYLAKELSVSLGHYSKVKRDKQLSLDFVLRIIGRANYFYRALPQYGENIFFPRTKSFLLGNTYCS